MSPRDVGSMLMAVVVPFPPVRTALARTVTEHFRAETEAGHIRIKPLSATRVEILDGEQGPRVLVENDQDGCRAFNGRGELIARGTLDHVANVLHAALRIRARDRSAS
jgi:hypothetical protein